MPLVTQKWDSAEFLKTPEDQAAYLEAAAEGGDPKLFAYALGQVARARGMTEIAREAGVSRVALYQSLAKDGDPKLSTVLGVMKAIGVRMKVEAA